MRNLSDQLKDKETEKQIKQAIKNDQALEPIAKDIDVTVTSGAVALDGEVSKKEQADLASNTAKAVGVVDKVNNRIEVKNVRPRL